MGNHGILVTGSTVAESFNRLYYLERAAGNYIQALQSGRPLSVLADEVAEKTAKQLEAYPEQDERHFQNRSLYWITRGPPMRTDTRC